MVDLRALLNVSSHTLNANLAPVVEGEGVSCGERKQRQRWDTKSRNFLAFIDRQ